jgi:hypothetical protein
MKFQIIFASVAVVITLAGCETTGNQSAGGASHATGTSSKTSGSQTTRYRSPDGRAVEVGRATANAGGRLFKNPHMSRCWLADGFDFNGYDTLYIAPTASIAKFDQKNSEEIMVHEAAKSYLPSLLALKLDVHHLFVNIVTNQAEIKPGAKVLKLENTITEFTKGGGAARYFAGLYGGGQPVLRVQGKMTDGEREVFSFEARRSGTSGGARMTGAFLKDMDIQAEDIHSMTLDVSDFMAAMAGKYEPRN